MSPWAVFCCDVSATDVLKRTLSPAAYKPCTSPASINRRLNRRASGPSSQAAQHDLLLAVTLPGMRRQAAGASPGQQTAPLSVQAGGINPRRLAMILSTMRFGSTAVIKCRIGSGVIW